MQSKGYENLGRAREIQQLKGLWSPRIFNLWPTVGHLVHTRWIVLTVIFPTTLLVYRSAIYPQGMTSKYGLGGRLGNFQTRLSVIDL